MGVLRCVDGGCGEFLFFSVDCSRAVLSSVSIPPRFARGRGGMVVPSMSCPSSLLKGSNSRAWMVKVVAP